MKLILLLGGAALLATLLWLGWYLSGLYPSLIAEVPVQEFSDSSLAYGARSSASWVRDACAAHGVNSEHVFAIRGKAVVRIAPGQFHHVYGTLITRDANPDTIYLYRYRQRYEIIVRGP